MSGYDDFASKKTVLIDALRETATLVGESNGREISLNGAKITPGLGLESEALTLNAHAKDLREGIFKVLIFGGFNNGKSTLLNAMLRDKLLPTDVLECTAVITVLVYGEGNQVEVYEVGKEKPRPPISARDFIREFKVTDEDRESLKNDGIIDRFENIEYAKVQCRSQLCSEGVRIIDAPGLGATFTRERVANNYLREAHATILMLDALRLLDITEKSFIRQEFLPGQVDNVFFVVNKMNLLNTEEQARRIKDEMFRFLSPLYTKNDSFDQDLYNRRVFFVNALAAEESILEEPLNLVKLESSGVLAFERELEKFLTSDDKNKIALLESTNELIRVIREACQAVARQKNLGQMSLEELKNQVELVKARLTVVESKLVSVENIVSKTGERVSSKLSSDLEDYIREMKRTWAEDADLLNWEALNPVNIIGATAEKLVANLPILGRWLSEQGFVDSEAVLKKIEKPLKQELDGYIRNKMQVWSNERAASLVQSDIEQMVSELEEFLTEFRLELKDVYKGLPNFDGGVDLGEMNVAKWVQLILAILLQDWGGLAGVFLEKADWGAFFMRIVQQIVAAVLLALVANIFGVLVFIVWEAWQGWSSFRKFKERVQSEFGKKLFEGLEEQLPTMRRELRGAMSTKFGELSEKIRTILTEQIESRRREFDHILRQKEDASFSFEKEGERLTQIETRLLELQRRVTASA